MPPKNEGAVAQAQARVAGRRLEAIYQALDSDNPQVALNYADQASKKFPTFLAVKVLRALALIRLGKREEAERIVHEIDTGDELYDTHTMGALQHFYKETDRGDLIIRLNETSARLVPNEENHQNLFFSYLRGQHYAKMVNTAQTLYKNWKVEDANDPKHYIGWVMTSLLLQAKMEPTLARISLPLALRNIEKHVADINGGKYLNRSELESHITACEMMNKWEEALRLCEMELPQPKGKAEQKQALLDGSKPLHFLRLQVLDYQYKLERFHDAVTTALSILKDFPDDWTCWKTSVEIVCKLMKKPDYPNEKDEETVRLFLTALYQYLAANGPHRGPHLARLELIYLLKKEHLYKEALVKVHGEYHERVLAYIKCYHKKPCCYVDVEKYLHPLRDHSEFRQSLDALFAELLKNYEAAPEHADSTENAARCFVLQQKIGLRLGRFDYSQRADKVALVQKVVKYWQSLKEKQSRRKNYDQLVGELVYLAFSTLWKDWEQRKENGWQSLVEADILAGRASQELRDDFFTKIAQMRLYGHVGCHASAMALYRMLDIKSVQQDTLGHYLFPIYEQTGRYLNGSGYYNELIKYSQNGHKEILDSAVAGFQKSAFSQVTGIMEVAVRVKNSTMNWGSVVMLRYLHILFTNDRKTVSADVLTHLTAIDKEIDWNGMCDNRDLSLLPSYEAGDNESRFEQEKVQSQREFVDIMQLKHYLLRAIAALARERDYPQAETLRDRVILLMTHLEHCRSNYRHEGPSRVLQSAVPHRLAAWVHGKHFDSIMRLFNCASEILMTQQENAEVTMELFPTPEEIRAMTEGLLPAFTSDGFFSVHEPLFLASRLAQTLSTCLLIISFIRQRLDKSASNKPVTKAQKKNPLNVRCEELTTTLLEVMTKLYDSLDEQQQHVKEYKSIVPQIAQDYDTETAAFISDDYDGYVEKLLLNYQICFRELMLVLQTRYKLKPVDPNFQHQDEPKRIPSKLRMTSSRDPSPSDTPAGRQHADDGTGQAEQEAPEETSSSQQQASMGKGPGKKKKK